MLEIILGRAKSGKTAHIMRRIREEAENRAGGQILLVPEQYSHEAERELCSACGDSLSLYGEVLSFTRLASAVEAETGSYPGTLLDNGGRMLVMSLALDAVGSRLRVYGSARRMPEYQAGLLSAVDEFISARVDAEFLLTASQQLDNGSLSDKLYDLSLIMGAYEAIAEQGAADPSHRLDLLCANLPNSSVGTSGHIYIDGFIDFTAQESAVIHALVKKGADVTVCLTCDSLADGSEIFSHSRRAAHLLLADAKALGAETLITELPRDTGEHPTAIDFLEEHLFSYTADVFGYTGDSVRLVTADSISAECEMAAARARELVFSTGCRWRDIAIAARGFADYRQSLEGAFRYYGVPLFLSAKSDILQKPLCTLVFSALEIVGAWEYDDIFAYLKTGLAGISREDCDILENYVLLWSLRAGAWTKNEPWRLHPDGYGGQWTDSAGATLDRINAIRAEVSAPLLALSCALEAAFTCAGHLSALTEYFDATALPGRLESRASELSAAGDEARAAQYVQLWDILVGAMEQMHAVLGRREMDASEFTRLFRLVIGRYDVGTIPVSLDSVSAGDMDRMRRRNIRHLIVLGADDGRLPASGDDGGIFSSDERAEMFEHGLELRGAHEDGLFREMNLIYNCLTLPSDTLTVCCRSSSDGESQPSFVYERMVQLFGVLPEPADRDAVRSYAAGPAFELAARAKNGRRSGIAADALAYFTEKNDSAARLMRLHNAAGLGRGALSRPSVSALYGDRLTLTPTRIDAFSSCRFAYFIKYGLKAKPRRKAGFDPPEMGSFMHFVLEGTAREIMSLGGFASVSREQSDAIADRQVEKYAHEELSDFRGRTSRFVYLFRRLTKTVRAVVSDMVDELSRSDFTPLDFELDFSAAGDLPAVELGDGDGSFNITGIADRVDGWLHDGRLYIRVVDYKTGKKAFSLSDVWYGMGLQMLLYLFSLSESGRARFGHEIVPAGVMYVPARDVLVSAPGRIPDDEIIAERASSLRRSGLLLDDPDVLAAMEHGDRPQYIPVTFTRSGAAVKDSLASLEQLGKLSRHINTTLTAMASELKGGSIAADPYWRGQQENACLWCDYFDACHFDENKGDARRYLSRLKAAEVWDRLEGGGNNE